MKLWIMSDLHQEFDELRWRPAETPEHDVLILAGDIHRSIAKAIDYARPLTDKPILLLAGNHEFYGGVITQQLATAGSLAAATPNLSFLENASTIIGSVRFLGCTLWMDFTLFGPERQERCEMMARRWMSDFELIRYETSLLRTEDAAELYRGSRHFLEAELARPWDGPTVVITHHAPHPGSIAARYQNDLLTPSFVNDLSELIEAFRPELWIHGHDHDAFDYHVGATRIVANPRDYLGEHTDFDPVLVIHTAELKASPVIQAD